MKKILLIFMLLGAHSVFALSLSITAIKPALLDDIALRLYHIRRLSKGVKNLVWLSNKKLVPLCLDCKIYNGKTTKTAVLNNECSFFHPRMISCLENIQDDPCITPFVQVWDDLIYFHLVGDQLIVREFTYLLFYLYKNIIRQPEFVQKYYDLQSINMALQHISSLEAAELEEILDVIDLLTAELASFIKEYEISSTLSWKKWGKKYWFIAPVGLGLAILKNYMKHLIKKEMKKISVFKG